MGRIAIVGIAESEFGKVPHRTAFQLHADAARAAIADAGLEPSEIDALFSAGAREGMHIISLAEYLGLTPRYADSTQIGGSAWELFIQHALGAFESGRCEVALLAYGSTSASDVKRGLRSGDIGRGASGSNQFETPYGPTLIAKYAMAAQRHMDVYGTKPEQLAEIAVAMRKNASLNPLAMYREPITVQDVLDSRYIAEPLHLLDCCIRTDGGGALVLTTEERARDLNQEPIYVLGAGYSQSHIAMSAWEDFTLSPAREAADAAYGEAGVGPQDIDYHGIYDSFTITVLLTLEALGLCEPGDGGPLVEGGTLAYDGAHPTNTDGGGLSCNQPGMRGLFLLIEAARQLRGGAGERQLDDPQLALCNGTGGWMSSAGTVILGRD